MHLAKKNVIKKHNISFELAYPTMKTQSAFLSDYYYYLIEIGYKEKAKTILQQLIEMDPSNETWQEEANRLDY